MANTIKELFVKAINNGFKSTEMIAEAKDKAMAYAAIATAIAQSGLIASNESAGEAEAPVKTPAASTPTGKDAIKTGADKGSKAAPKAPATPVAPVEPAVPAEIEIVEEWTDEMIELKGSQVEKLNALKEEYGDDVINQGVEMFSENIYHSIDEITPLNIDAFLDFVENMTSGQ
jgi:hypothetical protein